jgi:hypothetical protein
LIRRKQAATLEALWNNSKADLSDAMFAIESRVPAATLKRLSEMGHQITVRPDYSQDMGRGRLSCTIPKQEPFALRPIRAPTEQPHPNRPYVSIHRLKRARRKFCHYDEDV